MRFFLKLLSRKSSKEKNNKSDVKIGVIFYHSNINNIYSFGWIKECFESIIKQSYNDFSIYELNYGDDNFRLSRHFDFNKEYHYYQEKFSNHADAMNFVLNKAVEDGCDYVFNTNMDDRYHIDRFKNQIAVAIDGYDIVSSNFVYIDRDGNKGKEFNFSNVDIKESLKSDHNVIAHPSVCYSKKFIIENKYDSNRIPREDLELWKSTVNGYKYFICPEYLLEYRIHDNQISNPNSKQKNPKKIGLLIIATNKYVEFIPQLLESADEYFLKKHHVEYFIFTNKDIDSELDINTKRKYHTLSVEHKEWPWMTLGRYHIFNKYKLNYSNFDYLYYCDVDMKFENYVNEEIFGKRVATLHPGYYQENTSGTPERNTESTSYIFEEDENSYYAGGFNGGETKEFLKMSVKLAKNIDDDYKKDIIAIWHDESHLNHYFFKNKPTVILDPGYCYPENKILPFNKKLIALDKDHKLFREQNQVTKKLENVSNDYNDVYVPPPVVRPTVCRCGAPIDRVRYNFCQKCGNLY